MGTLIDSSVLIAADRDVLDLDGALVAYADDAVAIAAIPASELFYRNGDKVMACKVVRTTERLRASRPQLLWQGHYSHGRSTSCGRPGPTSSNYDVTADGQRFVMIEDKDEDIAPITRLNVVLNWTEELKRLERDRKAN